MGFPPCERIMASFVCDLSKVRPIIFAYDITFRDLFLSTLPNMNSSNLMLGANIFSIELCFLSLL